MNDSNPAAAVRNAEDVGPLVNNHQKVSTIALSLSDGRHAAEAVSTILPVIIRDGSWMDRLDATTGRRYTLKPYEFRRFIEAPRPLGLETDLKTIRRYLGEDTPGRIAFEQAIVGDKGHPISVSQPRLPNGRLGSRNDNSVIIAEESRKFLGPIITQVEQIPASEPEFVRVNVVAPASADRPMVQVDVKDGQPEKSKLPRTTGRAPTGNSLGATLNRLRRERPDLLARVEAKELTANAAAKEAGFRRPTMQLPLEPKSIARALKKRLTPKQIAEIIQLLS